MVLNWARSRVTLAASLSLSLLAPLALAEMEWTDPLALNTDAAADGARQDYSPYLATDGNGTWVAVWNGRDTSGGPYGDDMDVYFARSVDDGQTWSAPVPVDPAAATDDLHDSNAVVCTDGTGHWIVVWGSWDQEATSDIDLLYVVSTNGLDWGPPSYFNSDWAVDITRDHDNKPDIAADPSGHWVAVWFKKVDSPSGDEGDIYMAQSYDHGRTWSAPAYLHPSLANDTINEVDANIAWDGAGHWVATWNGQDYSTNGPFGTDQDILVSTSTNGVDWTAPTTLNTDASTDGLKDAYGDVLTDGDVWLATWTRELSEDADDEIMIARSTDHGVTWSPPTILNPYYATDGIGDDLRPRIAADHNGSWVVTWYAKDHVGFPWGPDYDLVFMRSDDGALTWSEPAVLNTSAAVDGSWRDYAPEVLATTNGLWLSAWYSLYDLGGTIGNDRDILFSRACVSVLPGDHECDGDCDLADFAAFQVCYAPAGPVGEECGLFDFDKDEAVDLDDFAALAAALGGPGL